MSLKVHLFKVGRLRRTGHTSEEFAVERFGKRRATIEINPIALIIHE